MITTTLSITGMSRAASTLTLTFALTLGANVWAQSLPGDRLSATQRTSVTALGRGVQVRFGHNEVPETLTGSLGSRSHPGDPTADALAAVDRHSGAFRRGPDDTFVATSIDAEKNGGQSVLLEQRYKGVPVVDGGLRVRMDGDSVTAISGRFFPDLNVDTSARLSPSEAATAAMASRADRARNPHAAGAGDPVIYVDADGAGHLAFPVQVGDERAADEEVFVSAASGRVVGQRSIAQALIDPCAGSTSLTCATNVLKNSGFENGNDGNWKLASTTGNQSAILWNTTSSSGCLLNSAWCAWLNGYGFADTESIAQVATIPASASSASVSFYLKIATQRGMYDASDSVKVTIRAAKPVNTLGTLGPGAVLATVAAYTSANAWIYPFSNGGFIRQAFDVSQFRGQTVFVVIEGQEKGGATTSFFVDSVVLTVY